MGAAYAGAAIGGSDRRRRSRVVGGLQQLQVDLDLDHVAQRDRAHARRQRDVDAEVLPLDLRRRFEAGVTRPAGELLDRRRTRPRA